MLSRTAPAALRRGLRRRLPASLAVAAPQRVTARRGIATADDVQAVFTQFLGDEGLRRRAYEDNVAPQLFLQSVAGLRRSVRKARNENTLDADAAPWLQAAEGAAADTDAATQAAEAMYPEFMAHTAANYEDQLDEHTRMRAASDLSRPHEWYPRARLRRRETPPAGRRRAKRAPRQAARGQPGGRRIETSPRT